MFLQFINFTSVYHMIDNYKSGKNGPVSSIRFELLREGIEDYEYIWMLKNKGAADFAEKIVNNLVIDVSTFSRNLDELYLSRIAIARKLEELVR